MSALALIQLGNRQLALPYPSVAGIENIRDAKADRSDNANFWQLQRGSQHWSLFSLDDQLQPQRQLDGSHRLALCFKQLPIAITCSGVESIHCDTLIPLPAIMRKPAACLRGFILHQGNLALVIDAQALSDRMAHFFTAGACA